MALKRKKLLTLNEAFDKAVSYVVNRPEFGKRDPEDKEGKLENPLNLDKHDASGKSHQNKRRWDKPK